MFRALWRETIWAKGQIPRSEYKYRWLKRYVLPLYDVLAIITGIFVVVYGLPTMELLFSPELADWFGHAFVVVAIVCLIGVCFPRLWIMEVVGKWCLIGCITAYGASLICLGLMGMFSAESDADHLNRFAVGLLVLMSVPLPAFRMHLLAVEARNRKNAQ